MGISGGSDMSVGRWVITLIISIIPVIGFIFVIIWAITDDSARREWAIATLIVSGIVLVISVLVFVITITMGVSTTTVN